MMRQIVRFTLILLVIIALFGSIWWATRPKPVSVVVKPVERGSVEDTVANTRAGTVKACRRASLSPSIGGQIARLDIQEGDRVKEGQLLLELWNQDLQAELQLAQSEANAAEAKARSACLQAEVGQREADRLLKLQKKGVASIEQTDKAVTEAKARQASCEAAHATARVSLARIAVAKAQLERTRLTAPFAGLVAEINGELNEYVTPSPIGIPTPPAIDLRDTQCFYVSAPIDEVDVPGVQIGQTARITLDAFPDQFFPGQVKRIAVYVLDKEKQARTVEVEVSFLQSEDQQAMLAGYSADIEILLTVAEDTLRIPSEAVLENEHVFVFEPETKQLVKRQIMPGLANWDYTQVLSGLKLGEQVVISVDRAGVEEGAFATLEQTDKSQ